MRDVTYKPSQTTHHPNRSLLRVVAHYQVDLPYIEALFPNRCGYHDIEDAILELVDDLHKRRI